MEILYRRHQPMAGERLQQHIEQALAAKAPESRLERIGYRLMKWMFDPQVIGADRIPNSPCLFVGNHSLFALDGMVFLPLMQHEFGRFVRPLGDKLLFMLPKVGSYLTDRGPVIGHPEVCSSLMQHGQDLLVFPGGSRESVKPADQNYTLQWRGRYGFVRCAAMHGYKVMPFAIVGPDEFYSHLVEGETLRNSVIGRLLKRLGILDDHSRTDIIPPITRGSLGSPIPKPQRCYIGFGELVDLAVYRGKKLTKQQLRTLRERVAKQIEQQLRDLVVLREQSKGGDGLLRRMLTI